MRRSGAGSRRQVDPEQYRRWRPTVSIPSRPPSPERAPDDPHTQQQDAGYEEIKPPLGPSPTPGERPTRDKPFVLLGCVLNVFELAENIMDFSMYAYGRGSLTTRPVTEFVIQLTSFGVALRSLRDGEGLCEVEEIVRERPHARDEVLWHRRDVDYDIADIRRLIAWCEDAMPYDYRERDGSIGRLACLKFVRAFMGDRQLLRHLLRSMRNWCSSFDRYCKPRIMWMEDENERLLEDKRRRELRRERTRR